MTGSSVVWVWIGSEANKFEVDAAVWWLQHQQQSLRYHLSCQGGGGRDRLWESVVHVEWIKAGSEPHDFWAVVRGPPPAGTQVAGAGAVMQDTLYEHLPLQHGARTPPRYKGVAMHR